MPMYIQIRRVIMNDFGMNDFWKKSLEFQQNMVKNWMDTMQGAAQGSADTAENAGNPLSAVMKTYQDMYSNWQNQFMGSPLMKLYPWSYNLFNTSNTPFDIANKMMNGGKTYTDLFGIWQRLSGKGPFESRDELIKCLDENRAAFERLSEDFMMPFVPEAMRPLVAQARALMKQFEGLGQDFIRPWTEIGKSTSENMQKILKGDQSAYAALYKALNEAYNDSFGKLFSATGLGLTKEQNEEILNQFDSFFRMMLALTELLALVADVSKDNMVSLVEAYQDMVSKGSEPKSMKEFYNLWLKINEDSFVKVFGTPQFAQIFGEFSKRACEFKIHLDKVLERTLNWLPVPKNSEMSSLYKTVYELRKSDYFQNESIEALKAEVAALKEIVNGLRKSK